MFCGHCGLIVDRGCERSTCPVCGPRIAREKARVVAYMKPQRFGTLTLAPQDWQAARWQVKRWLRSLHRAGYEYEIAFTCELTKSGLRHVHFLQRGAYVKQAELQDRWGAIVDIRAIHGARAAAGYALKEAMGVASYALKGTSDLREYLRLNGGRFVHPTRGYLSGRTQASIVREIRGSEHRWVPLAA